MTNACVLSLDMGTSSTRAIAFDTGGRNIGEVAQRPYAQTTTPDGGVEVDADLLFDLTASCIDELLPQIETPIIAVGMSCFWHSLLAVGPDGRPRTGVLSWADNRSAAWVPALRALLDEDDMHARTGCVAHTSYWPAKLLWLQQSRPELFEGQTRWMSFAEYFALRVSGETRCSISMASGTGLFHQVNCDWDAATLAVLPLHHEQLSPLCDAADPLPEMRPEYSIRWPKLTEARWFPGLGDGACSNIGSGGVDNSHLVLNAGTSGALRVVLENYTDAAPRGLWRYRIDRRRSVMGGAISNVGNVLLWALSTLKLPDDWDARIADLEAGAHGLVVLPFLAGERSPLWNANARLVVEGASLDTNSLEILRACLEASSLRFAEIAESVGEAVQKSRMAVENDHLDIIFSGGALDVSPAWTQITCDCLGVPLVESREKEASARGAALMALEACGEIENISDAAFERGRVVQPDAVRHSKYQRARERQNALYEQLYGGEHFIR